MLLAAASTSSDGSSALLRRFRSTRPSQLLCQLWSTMFQYSYSKLRVAYNDTLRQLLMNQDGVVQHVY